MKIDEKLLEGLSDEMKEKALQCQSQEELTALLNEYGGALSEDQLDAVAGGLCCAHCNDYKQSCPLDCHSYR